MNTIAEKNSSTTTAKSANRGFSEKSTSAAAIATATQSIAAAAQVFTSAAAATPLQTESKENFIQMAL